MISPEDASDLGVVWESADTKVVSVASDGTVTAIGPGTTTVTATTNDGSFTSNCVVSVKSPAQHVSLDKTSLKLLRRRERQTHGDGVPVELDAEDPYVGVRSS